MLLFFGAGVERDKNGRISIRQQLIGCIQANGFFGESSLAYFFHAAIKGQAQDEHG
jgi:hypothetical protein